MLDKIAEIFTTQNSTDVECVLFSDIYNSDNIKKIKKAYKLLKIVHDGIYVKHFPLEDEQEDLSVWVELLQRRKHVYIVFGKNLDTIKPEIMGLVIAGLYANSGLIEYIIREKSYASQLRGIEILNKAVDELNKLCLKTNGEKIDYIYWELNDPDKIDYSDFNPLVDCMSPKKRMDMVLTRYNAKLLGLNYVQPPLTEGQNICDNLKLARIDINKTKLSDNCYQAQKLLDYLRDFTFVLTKQNPDDIASKMPLIKTMFNQVKLMIEYNISPLEENQTEEQKALLKSVA